MLPSTRFVYYKIWETSDVYNVGYLDPETFSIALKLIACAQHGRDVQDPILSTGNYTNSNTSTISAPVCGLIICRGTTAAL